MNLLAVMRHHQSRASRLVTAMFVVGWLGFAAVPCQAMPELPPADDCAHCPVPAADSLSDCATMAPSDCLSASQPLQDVRQIEQPKFAALPTNPPVANQVAFVRAASGPNRVSRIPLPHASIQQRYCSYLK